MEHIRQQRGPGGVGDIRVAVTSPGWKDGRGSVVSKWTLRQASRGWTTFSTDPSVLIRFVQEDWSDGHTVLH